MLLEVMGRLLSNSTSAACDEPLVDGAIRSALELSLLLPR
jgi:hypothetical protein